jgi:hypothetical protein
MAEVPSHYTPRSSTVSDEYKKSGLLTDLMESILNAVVLIRKRTIPTERPQPDGEVSANFSW